MIVKSLKDEDFVNYKTTSMLIGFPICSFKCNKECNTQVCQNSTLAVAPNIDISAIKIVKRYLDNPITSAIVCAGLEPFDSWEDLKQLVALLRKRTNDDIVIYTGYNKDEVIDYINELKNYPNIIVKFGRYIPNQKSHYDETLGVYLASSNQYAERIS